MRRLIGCAAASMALALWIAGPASAWSWPLRGDVLRPFSLGADAYAAGQHRGVDVAGNADEDVLAPVPGTVTFAGSVPTHGKVVTVLTADGLSVTLTHLGAIGVEKGAAVGEGQVIGRAGASGAAEHPGPYVHLGVRVAADDNGYLDPLRFLPPRVVIPPPAPASAPAPVPAPAPAAAAAATDTATAPASVVRPAAAPTPAAAPVAPSPQPVATTGREQSATASGAAGAPASTVPEASAAATSVAEGGVEQRAVDAPSPSSSDGGSARAHVTLPGKETAVVTSSPAAGPKGSDGRATAAARPEAGGSLERPNVLAPRKHDRSDAFVAGRAIVVGDDGGIRRGRVAGRPTVGTGDASTRATAPAVELAARAVGAARADGTGGGWSASAGTPGDRSTTPHVLPAPRPRGAIALSARPGGDGGIPARVLLALALLTSILVAATAAPRSARRIDGDGALLRHHPDLLRQLDAAHRPCVHDDRGRRLRAAPAAARA